MSEGRTMRCPASDCDWSTSWTEPPYEARNAAGSLYDAHWRRAHKLAPIIVPVTSEEHLTQLHDAGCPSAVPEIPVGGEGCTCEVMLGCVAPIANGS